MTARGRTQCAPTKVCRGKTKNASPLSLSGVRRKHTSHGSTLLVRSAETPGSRTTVTRADRKTGRAKPGGIFGGAWNSWPSRRAYSVTSDRLCLSVTGKPRPGRPGRLGSGTARRVSQGASTVRAPLCPPLCGFFSVNAGLTGEVYHGPGRVSRDGQELTASSAGSSAAGSSACGVSFRFLAAVRRSPSWM